MPRIRQNAEQYAREDFQKEIRISQARYGLMSQRALCQETGIPASTFCKLMQEPERFTIENLKKVVDVIHPDPMAILALLGYKRKDVKGLEEME